MYACTFIETGMYMHMYATIYMNIHMNINIYTYTCNTTQKCVLMQH